MWQHLERKYTFDADGQRYEIRWKASDDNCMRRLEVYVVPQEAFVLALEFGFPCSQEIEDEACCADREKKIEKMFKGKSLKLKDIIG